MEKNILLGQNIDTQLALKLGRDAIKTGRVNFFTFNIQEGRIDAKTQAIIGSLTQILPREGLDLDRATEQYQTNMITQALEQTSGNKTRAARHLGLNRMTLVGRMKRLHMKGGETP